MSGNPISLDLKRRCVEAWNSRTMTPDIYREIFRPEHPTMAYETFRSHLRRWRQMRFADDLTLGAGTYGGFTAHAATVQVGADGAIRQAWVKQSRDTLTADEILEAIRMDVKPVRLDRSFFPSERMLEIPFYDLHFGVATLEDYAGVLSETADLIGRRRYDEIIFVLGQDLLHTNDMRGHTASGTEIGVIDFPRAWNDAFSFYATLIGEAVPSANAVRVVYVPGNHDECTSWCLVRALEQRFPDVVFDSDIKPRKAIWWRRCFVGLCHGNERSKAPGDLRGRFTVQFPEEFAHSDVREVHAGHLHVEKVADLYGVMIRRTSSAVPTDEWSEREGYVGAIKRFQAFEWAPGRLKSIHFIQ